jgi:hypothetical protein
MWINGIGIFRRRFVLGFVHFFYSLHFHSYEYEVTVRMSSSSILSRSAEIVLKAQNIFGNFTQRLNTSDRIWFKGTLRSFMFDTSSNSLNENTFNRHANVHSTNGKFLQKAPLIEVNSIGCVHCNDADLTCKCTGLWDFFKLIMLNFIFFFCFCFYSCAFTGTTKGKRSHERFVSWNQVSAERYVQSTGDVQVSNSG